MDLDVFRRIDTVNPAQVAPRTIGHIAYSNQNSNPREFQYMRRRLFGQFPRLFGPEGVRHRKFYVWSVPSRASSQCSRCTERLRLAKRNRFMLLRSVGNAGLESRDITYGVISLTLEQYVGNTICQQPNTFARQSEKNINSCRLPSYATVPRIR